MNKYIPDRKFIASGISGLLAFALVAFLQLPAELATGITGAVMALVHYFVPASVGDVLRRVDAGIISLAEQQNPLR